jgi:hypothetical protein
MVSKPVVSLTNHRTMTINEYCKFVPFDELRMTNLFLIQWLLSFIIGYEIVTHGRCLGSGGWHFPGIPLKAGWW